MMHDKRLGDPIVVGLAAFVVAQTLLNLPNAHLVPPQVTLFFMPAILVCGGLVYFLACIFSYVRGDTFGLSVNGFYGAFFTSLFLFFYLELKGVLQFGTQANEALGVFLLIWTIVTVPFVIAAFRVQLMFGLLFLFVFFAFLGGTLANLAGVNSAFGGYSGLISAAIGLILMAEALLKSVQVHVPQPSPSVADLIARSEA
ncbi:acetate uptake transporter [Alicyclobacillus acidocaldarius]|nr:acetate uptake transporter [Alicyclobacillus acidocaldarius]